MGETETERRRRDRRARALLFAQMRRDGYSVAAIATLQGISRARVYQIMETACPAFDAPRRPWPQPAEATAADDPRPAWSYPDEHTLSIIRAIKAEMANPS